MNELTNLSFDPFDGMDQSLLDAMSQKLIDPDDAYRYATDHKKFERFVTDTTILPTSEVNVG